MRDSLFAAVGRLSVLADPLRGGVRPSPRDATRRAASNHEYDKTGLVMTSDAPLRLLVDESDLLYPDYDSMAHSLWRAQELSLFHAHRDLFRGAILDFGCGDGSFASLLFDRIEFGADNDEEALNLARRRRLYGQLLHAGSESIPLADATVTTVMSNSVLEHVSHLSPILHEIRRVLKDDGRLIFTVPNEAFTRHLVRYFGRRAAARVNQESTHRNLLGADVWRDTLTRHGFQVERMLCYQPPEFTFCYRMLRFAGARGLGRFIPGLKSNLWRAAGGRLTALVRQSIVGHSDGANLFFVARAAPIAASRDGRA